MELQTSVGEDMIDLDEAAIKLTHANRKHGKGHKGARAREEGPYGHDKKQNLLMAVTGRPGENDRFVDLEERPGTDILRVYDFIASIIERIGHGVDGDRRCFMMDNLSAHKHPIVLNLIHTAGHRYVFRAPYHPVDGPIEYVFDTIETEISTRMHEIFDLEDLRDATFEIINSIDNFVPYFEHVAFR